MGGNKSGKKRPTPKNPRGYATPIHASEVERLIAGCTNCPTGRRNRALITLLFRTGLRISEALALKPSDVNFKTGSVTVGRGKGGKKRQVGIGQVALDSIRLWMDTRSSDQVKRKQKTTKGLHLTEPLDDSGLVGKARRDRRTPGPSPLFCTVKGEPIADAYPAAMLKRLAKKARIETRVHLHGLRAGYATRLHRATRNILVVQGELGHSNAAITAGYLAKVDPSERNTIARDAFEAYDEDE